MKTRIMFPANCSRPPADMHKNIIVARLFCIRRRITPTALELMGQAGLRHGNKVEKYFRNAKQIQALAGIFPMKKIRYLKRYFHISP